uniref:Uncharacterized protein n=1 Tax=Arundo donax TaxID=35708 RepID=A0A0A9CGZ4_ARUDO
MWRKYRSQDTQKRNNYCLVLCMQRHINKAVDSHFDATNRGFLIDKTIYPSSSGELRFSIV